MYVIIHDLTKINIQQTLAFFNNTKVYFPFFYQSYCNKIGFSRQNTNIGIARFFSHRKAE